MTPIVGPLRNLLGSQKAVIMLLGIGGAFAAWMLDKITVEQFGIFVLVTLPAWTVSHALQDGLTKKAP